VLQPEIAERHTHTRDNEREREREWSIGKIRMWGRPKEENINERHN
jgi:hypothetical protein